MNIQLSDHFTYKRLIRFVFPSIIMMICTSMYSIIDGLFISNFAGKTAFAAVNLILPVAMGVGAIGFMIGSGGSAIVAKTLGEKKEEKANEYFSMLIFTALIGATILSVFGFIFIRQICMALGARGQLLEYASTYGRIMFVSQPMFMMQTIFYNFFITAEKPSYSLRMSLISGVINIVFDYLFIGVMHYGVAGAAVATAMGEYVGGLVPLIYFARKNNSSRLRLVKPVWRKDILLKTCLNGSSEFMTNASSSVVNMLYNRQLMRLAGADGVAAYGVIMYANFIFAAIYLGYSMGSAPITSYNYGAGNHSELKNMLKKDQMQHTHQMLVHGLLHAISHFHAQPRTSCSWKVPRHWLPTAATLLPKVLTCLLPRKQSLTCRAMASCLHLLRLPTPAALLPPAWK